MAAVTIRMGVSQSGKTLACFQDMRRLAAQGKKVLLIVPDQASYSVERRFAETAAGKGYMGIQIVGFARLAYLVLQARGTVRDGVSELGQKVILQRLLRQYEDEFSLLQTAARQANFATTAGQFIAECRSFCISPEMLRRAADNLGDSTLGRKLQDIALLYDSYVRFLTDHFGSADDILTVLAKTVPDDAYIRDAYVWVDGFQWFTPEQLAILEAIEGTAKAMTVTLTIDGTNVAAHARETALFHRAYEVYRELRTRFPHAETLALPKPVRGGLQPVYDGFFRPVPQALPQPVAGLTLTACSTRDLEIDKIARKICQLCKAGYRYGDMLVLARTSDLYQHRMERIFTAYGIPFFSDYRRPMTSHPVAEAVASLLDVLQSHWSYEPLFRLLKTDVFPVSRHDVDILENYCLEFGIQGRHWLSGKEWTYRRKRYIDEETKLDEKEEARLVQVNRTRQTIYDILAPVQDAAQEDHALRDWCTLLYRWLVAIHVPQTLQQWQCEDDAAGDQTAGKEHEQVWKRILAFLDEVVRLCGDDVLSLAEFGQIVTDGLGDLQFSLIPPTLDHVTFTSVERGYTMLAKVVFVCGINDGIFPQHSSDDGMLSDGERRQLGSLGITLGPSQRFRSFQEKFLFYLSLTRAQEKLCLSYALADEDGNAVEPSLWARQLVEKGYVSELSYETGQIAPGQEGDYIVTMPAALAYVPSRLHRAGQGEPVDDVWWALYDWAWHHGYTYEAIQSTQGIFHTNLPQVLPTPLVRKLYAPDGILRGSVTKFEQYRACPFAYFARYGLKLEERRLYRFAAPDLGMLVHGALRILGEELLDAGKQWQDLQPDEIPKRCREATDRLAPQVQQDILMSNAYFQQIKERLIATLVRTVRRLREFSAVSDFKMEGLEKSFGRNGSQWQALKFTLKNGLTVIVNGQIDRVDSLRLDGTKYVVIIDYKSGQKKLDISQIFTGLELQLLTYMYVTLLNMGDDAVPAAILYCYVRNDKMSVNYCISPAEKEALYQKNNKLSGFYLDDSRVIQSLDTSLDGYSAFMNVRLKKDGTLSDTSQTVYDTAGWKHLLHLAKGRIEELAGAMAAGNIDMKPIKMGQVTPCSYCPYHSVCRFDDHLADNGYDVVDKKTCADQWAKELKDTGGTDHGLD